MVSVMKGIINSLSRYWRRRSLGLFCIRAVAGLLFVWLGLEALQIGSGIVAWLEVVGGIALFLGVLPRIFGAVLGIVMLVTLFSNLGAGLDGNALMLMLMASSFGIAFIGSGWISLFRLECALCGGMLCAKDEDCPKRQPG